MAKRRRNKHKNKPQPSSQPSAARQQSTVEVTPQQNNEARGSLQTISQERARHALDNIQNVKGISEDKLKSYIVGMPAMILMSGFGQTCAFYVSKAEFTKEDSKRKDEHKAYGKVVEILWGWLKEHVSAFADKPDLMTAITHVTAQEYQLAEAESLEYLNWLKKFAKAYLKGDE